MTKETLKHPDCFLVREDSIRRLPRLVFAASEACRRKKESMAALPKALGAQCTVCGFVLSGEELLALAEISSANKESAMLQRLRHGRCARESCKATHYRLQFYDIPEISWSALLAESRPSEASKPPPEPETRPAPGRRAILRKVQKISAGVGVCLLVWMWWQWRTGGRIPILREPEHFRVAPGNLDDSANDQS